MKNPIRLIKNRSDIGAGTRGSDMGIDAIEIAAINKGSEYFNNFPFVDVETHNETIYNKDRNSFAKRIAHVLEQCTRVAQTVENTLLENCFPLVFSGDHSSALGTISGIKTAYPDKTLAVIWIDAHADLHSPFTSPSGNIHGMPLAAALASDNLSCKVNKVEVETVLLWDRLKKIGTAEPKLKPEHLIYFGVRDTEAAEDIQMENSGIRNYKVEEVRYRGLATCVGEALEKIQECDLIYISFDVDSMDCDLISQGTGTPVSKGFDQYEVIAIIEAIIASQKVVCFEVVEVNPLLDNKGNKMAETTFEVLERVTGSIGEYR
ncbi:arginase [Pedobacter africanus]|uniref:Arginase n=1 Tax=Pedobacter africanus TaxID=151894 RepID=A0ACC6KQP9_9SPHI|nr:arginase [Pedobacter africanus]MDR6781462.1 arginase [Pedobacter africanus]